MHSVMADKTPRPITLINQTTPFLVYLARLRHVLGSLAGTRQRFFGLSHFASVVTKCSY